MRRSLATIALAGTLGLTGIAGAVLVAPTVASAATGQDSALTERASSIRSALAGLVTDGSLTQAQADEVATTLAEARREGRGGRHGGPGRGGHGRGGHHGGPGRFDGTAAAKALGITRDQLRTRVQAGETLGQIADAEDVARPELVQALVASAKERLAEKVTDGRLTQAEADERAATLTERVTALLDRPLAREGRD